jgi:TPR repeat protein
MYDNGYGVPENDAEAVKWYRKAVEQGLATTQSNLGLMYARGEGVPENDVEALKWYSLAKAQGNKRAAGLLNMVKNKMTPAQIAKAQALAAEWWEKHNN